MSETPTLSVLIPAYGAADRIADAVRSVLAQDFADWEIVIASDDGADYLEVLRAHGIDDGRIRQVIASRSGSGCANARNAALAAARGALITPLDADDVFLPDRLATLVPIALETGAVVDNVVAVEEGTGRVLSFFIPPDERASHLTAERFFRTSVPAKPMLRRDLGLRWDPDTGLSDDVVYVVRLLDLLGPLRYVARPLQEYRVIDGSLCHRDDSVAIAEYGYTRFLQRIDDGTLPIEDAALREAARIGVAYKRELNRAFGEAQRAGFAGTFQHFAAREDLTR